MLNDILQALRARHDVQAWSVQHIVSRGAQVYAVPNNIEARREVNREYFVVEVLRLTRESGSKLSSGNGNVTLLPGDDIDRALDTAILTASLMHNPPYAIPSPRPLPDVPLADPELQKDPDATLDRVFAAVRNAAAQHPSVRLTSAECFGEEATIHLLNSRGINATQVLTRLHVEFVLLGRRDGDEVESFVEFSRRRSADLDLTGEMNRQAQYAVDRLAAKSPPNYDGPVILRGSVLSNFLNGDNVLVNGPFQTRVAASSKYNQLTAWEIGQSIFPHEVKGDPLNMWANRTLPYGLHADRFDEEGLPAQRLPLIRDNRLVNYVASQRYAEYLGLRPTGAFGDIEVAPGSIPAADLLAEPHIEIAAFSWFNPNQLTGDFTSEIRLGYIVEGNKRTPFKGGQLIGNVFDALADVRWSSETDFFGDYQGPTTARFANLKISGE
jgi:predicted Zn-dependent protease